MKQRKSGLASRKFNIFYSPNSVTRFRFFFLPSNVEKLVNRKTAVSHSSLSPPSIKADARLCKAETHTFQVSTSYLNHFSIAPKTFLAGLHVVEDEYHFGSCWSRQVVVKITTDHTCPNGAFKMVATGN